jgi:hypothetical protein
MFVSEIAYSSGLGADLLSAATALRRVIPCPFGDFNRGFATGTTHQIAAQAREARGAGSGAGVIRFQVPMVDDRQRRAVWNP